MSISLRDQIGALSRALRTSSSNLPELRLQIDDLLRRWKEATGPALETRDKLSQAQTHLGQGDFLSVARDLSEVAEAVSDDPLMHAMALSLRIAVLRLEDINPHRELRNLQSVEPNLSINMTLSAAALAGVDLGMRSKLSPEQWIAIGGVLVDVLIDPRARPEDWAGCVLSPREFRELAAACASQVFHASSTLGHLDATSVLRPIECGGVEPSGPLDPAFATFWAKFDWVERTVRLDGGDQRVSFFGKPKQPEIRASMQVICSTRFIVEIGALKWSDVEATQRALRDAGEAGLTVPDLSYGNESISLGFDRATPTSVLFAEKILEWLSRGRQGHLRLGSDDGG